jgi:aspartyl-tRNA(Asn)/glutamyl-tRNA(Gln) amidotransferase subunit C
MALSRTEVERVAKLARLEISEGEEEIFARQLSEILDYVRTLNGLATDGIEPTATVLERTDVFRDDEIRRSLPVELALANAPESEDGFFRVPKIIEER